jgi:hypothetical protein
MVRGISNKFDDSRNFIQKFSELIARFGIPKTITSDGAKCFTDFEFQACCKNLGIRHI